MPNARKAITAHGQPLLNRSDVARRFGVSPQTITRWANEGLLTCVRTLGGQRRYPAPEVERLLTQVYGGQSEPEPAAGRYSGRESGGP